MGEMVELLDGINADHRLRCGADKPELSILKGDELFVRAAGTADEGEIVVITVGPENLATICRHYPGVTEGQIVGVVEGVFRRLGHER